MERNNRGGVTLEKLLLWYGHPVGSYYWSDDPTEPATIFGGGTWVQIKDTFLLTAGNIYKVGDTGGEATHTLTVNEMPSHNHTFSSRPLAWDSGFPNSVSQAGWGGSIQWDGVGNTNGMNKTGGDSAHNNMPPYLATYCWRRTA